MTQVVQKASIEREHFHVVGLESGVVLLCVVGPRHQDKTTQRQRMRHVHRVALREHMELEAQVSQVLDPLHLVEAVVDEAFVKERQPFPPLHHHIGLQKPLLEAGHTRGRHGRRQRHPLVREIVLE